MRLFMQDNGCTLLALSVGNGEFTVAFDPFGPIVEFLGSAAILMIAALLALASSNRA